MPAISRLSDKGNGALYMGAGLGWGGDRKIGDKYKDFVKNNPAGGSAVKFLLESADVGTLVDTLYCGNTADWSVIVGGNSAINKIGDYLSGSYSKVSREGLASFLQDIGKGVDRDLALYGADKILTAGKFAARVFFNKRVGRVVGKMGNNIKNSKEVATAKNLDRTKFPVGRRGQPLKEFTKDSLRNTSKVINGRKFTGHALDQMLNRGVLSPSVVLDTIKNPIKVMPGQEPGTKVFFGNKLKVVLNELGDVITVITQ